MNKSEPTVGLAFARTIFGFFQNIFIKLMLYDIGTTTIGTLFGQILNFFQEILFAANFGTNWTADSYILALTIPTIIANEVIGWINGVFIPVYVDYREKQGLERAKQIFIASFKILLFITFIIMVIGIILSPFITKIVAGNFTNDAKTLTVDLMIALFILIILIPVTTLFSNFLNAHNKFLIPALGKVIIYAVMIISMVLFTRFIGIYSVVWGIVLGHLMFLLVQILSVRKNDPSVFNGYSQVTVFGAFRDSAVREMGVLLIPLLFASAANQVNILVERGIVTRFAEGSLASLNYAIKLTIFPVNLLFSSIMTVLFPVFSKHISTDNKKEIASLINKALKYLFLVIIPVVVGLVLLREPIVRIIFERGAFTALSTKTTSTALGFYAPGLIGLGGIIILSKVYFALKDTKRLTVIGIIMICLNIICIVLFSKIFGFIGIPLAFSIVSNIHMVILYVFIRKKINL